MIMISYRALLTLITAFWLLIRVAVWFRQRKVFWKREAQLILVYICMIVVVRFTFFPFSKVGGSIQPLIFDVTKAFPPRINLVPIVNLFDYLAFREALLNLFGNTLMFLPLGIVWPGVYRQLNTHKKVILSGFLTSLGIEILQLPFFDRVSDIDDLILNTLGFLMGYGVYLLVKKCRKKSSA